MSGIGFDNAKYLSLQSEKIRERIAQFGGKLYMEFGGKLFDDYHASRVLPGFEPDSKIRMLLKLKEQVEMVVVINAEDIEKNRVRSNLGIPYVEDALRLMDIFRGMGLYVGSVVVTRYAGQPGADRFMKRLADQGIKSYKHYTIPGYPSDIARIVSEEGYGRNEYIETTRPLVVVTASGAGSGKMATCLSQLYHEHKRGVNAGYAKYETFPIWNLPLKHPVNLAYEAATADLNDVNMLDPFHLEAYGEKAVNYNRDVEIFPVLNAMLQKILGVSPYQSPTDMGVNMAGFCIVDEDKVNAASRMEIIRRYYTALCDRAKGNGSEDTIQKLELLISQTGIVPAEHPMVVASLKREAETGGPAAAMMLPDGRIVTGKTSDLMGCASSLLLNALKALAGINNDIDLISPQVISPICSLKTENLGSKNPKLHSDEVLIALCVSAVTNPVAALAMKQLPKLRGCDAHFSVIPSSVDEKQYRKLGIDVSCEPRYEETRLYHK